MDQLLDASINGIPMAKPAGVLLQWRDHQRRLSRHDPRCATEQFIAAKAWALKRLHLQTRPAIICGTGRQALSLHDSLVNEGVKIHSFVDINPSRIGGLKRGLPVWSIQQLRKNRSNELLLGVVGAWNARDKLRTALEALGFRDSKDFLMAA